MGVALFLLLMMKSLFTQITGLRRKIKLMTAEEVPTMLNKIALALLAAATLSIATPALTAEP